LASHDFPLAANQLGLAQLNERSREIFRQIVESYLATGEPVGSRNLSRILPMTLSPASVRNVMSDLEQLGLSTRRTPRPAGCRPNSGCGFSSTPDADRRSHRARPQSIEARSRVGQAKSVEAVLDRSLGRLSG
jgi:heat-inducible transcriptional repressor